MKIIILGAGQVGSTIATQLHEEAYSDITVVDTNAERLHVLQEKLDIRTVVGLASYPNVLTQAGINDADMLVAVTNSDEVNMIACQIAYSLFRVPTKIARIRSHNYTMNTEGLFERKGIPIDVIISPEQIVTRHISRLIRYPGALQVLNFASKKIKLASVILNKESPLIHQPAHALTTIDKNIEAKLVAIFREEKGIIPSDDTMLQTNDEIFFIAPGEKMKKLIAKVQNNRENYQNIMIAGGGDIGLSVAKLLENNFHVKLIEINSEHCLRAAEELNTTLVLQGDATDHDLLKQEHIENIDMYCSITNDDEDNIMSAMQAKRLGAKHVMALINRPTYADLVQGGDIDIAISPQHATIGALLAHIRRGDVERVHSLRKGAAEAIEAVAHGDEETSEVVGRCVSELKLPEGATVGALVRGDTVYINDLSLKIASEDHLIIFLTDKKDIREVERLFQVSATFVS